MHPISKREVDVLEEKGLWKAHSYLANIIRRLVRKKLPLEIRYINEAHKIIFETANQRAMAGKYRRDNPELKRLDGSLLKIAHWKDIPHRMAELDFELRDQTKKLKAPQTELDYKKIIMLAATMSHRLACIHPYENGNGRASRLLINAMLLRANLPEIAFKKPKQAYLRAMRQADDSDFLLLAKMISDGLLEKKQKAREEAQKKSFRHSHKKL